VLIQDIRFLSIRQHFLEKYLFLERHSMIDRILQLMKERNVKDVEVVRELGLSNGIFTQWKNGKAKPSTDAVIKLAEYFGVSTDYLLTGKEFSNVQATELINVAQENKAIQSLYAEYTLERKKIQPDLGKLLSYCDTMPVYEILILMNCHFPFETRDRMDSILAMAVRNMTTDDKSLQFIIENVFERSSEIHVPVLKRLMELERIEPLDVEAFDNILLSYCLSAVVLNSTELKLDVLAWQRGLENLFIAFVKPKGK